MISKLVKKQKNIIFCGDVHQTVNPTFFKFGRLKNLYYSYKLDVQDFILTKNYRNSKGIISLTNKLSTYRQTLIGKTPYDYGTKGIRSGQSPMVIETSHSNILRILKGIKDKHYAAIIVADEEDKQYLINKCPEAQGRIFTVYEIKGLEYETIFCYNIISKHFCSWKKIFNGDAKRKDQYRYYINLFYVAISRAKDHLFILEPEYKNMPSDLLHDCAFVENADHKTYHLYKESSNADWEKEASRLENIGNTEKSRVARDFMREQQLKEMNSLSNHYIKTGNQKLNLTINMENNDLKNGIKYLRLQKYNQAIHSLQQFIENYPDDPEGYYYLGLVYIYVLSGTDYSIRFFDEALKLNPNRYEAYLDKAASLRFINETKKAIKTLNKAIDVNNNIGNAYFIKGIILFEAGQHKEAEDCFKTALRLPCYCFDSVNKVWNANPSLEEEQEFKHNIKQNYLRPCLAKNPPATELKEILQSISLTCEDLTSNNIVKKSDSIDYSLFKLDEEKRLIVACIEGKIPTNTTYSTSTKKYTVHFDKEVCIECQTFSVCPMSTANKIGELKVKKKKLFS